MRTITVAAYKGGTGKTTTVINMAYNLAQMGKKVLMIDADQQGNATYIATRRAYTGKTLLDVMQSWEIPAAVKKCHWHKNIDVVPANEEMERVNCQETTLKDRLREIEWENKYDYCLIDCHPSMQIMTINALVAADDLIIPMRADRFSLTGLDTMMGYVSQITDYNPDLNVEGCLITAYRPRVAQRDVIFDLAQTGYPLFNTVISDCEAVNTAQEVRKPLGMHRKNAKVTLEYEEFTKEYLERTEGWT